MKVGTYDIETVASFLAAYPLPVRRHELASWEQQVRTDLGCAALPALVELLEVGSPGEQYAARALGAEVWATEREPNLVWEVTLPGEPGPKYVHPRRQAVHG